MNSLDNIIKNMGFNIHSSGKRYIKVDYGGVIVTLDSYLLLSFSNFEIKEYIKDRYFSHGVFINNKDLKKYKKTNELSILDKKKKIRKLLKKNKLI